MYTNRQTFWHNRPTPTTRLGGVGWVHSDNLNTGALSLVFKHLPKQSKPGIMRRKGQVFIAVYKVERKVLDSYMVVINHNLITDLVQIIHSLIGDSLVQARNLSIGFALAIAPLGLPGDMALKTTQLCRFTLNQRGLSTNSPVERAARLFKPTSTPTCFPVSKGRVSGSGSSIIKQTYQRSFARLITACLILDSAGIARW